MTEKIYFYKWQSPIGELSLYSDGTTLLSLLFAEDALDFLKHFKNPQMIEHATPVIEKTIEQLKEYFAKARTQFDIPLNLLGTPFQKKAWAELAKIPYGSTISYSDQAKNMQAEKAVRAVGTANSKNPVAIIIPCHRVIASNGKIAGYAGGVNIKAKLLALEGVLLN